MDKYQAELATADEMMQQKIKSEIQKNYAKAEVFFQTLNVVDIAQSPAMGVSYLWNYPAEVIWNLIKFDDTWVWLDLRKIVEAQPD